MRWLFAIFLLAATFARAADWAVPSTAQGWWTPNTAEGTPGVGVPNGIDQYIAGGINDRATTGIVIDVTAAPHNADKTGVTDTSAAIWSAIMSASEGDVVYLPPGRYKLTQRLGLSYANRQNITIRGAGPSLTTIYMSRAGDPQGMIWTVDAGYLVSASQTVTGTKTKNTATLNVSSTAQFSSGNFAWLWFENETDNARIIAGSPPVWTSVGSDEKRRQLVRIMSKTSTTLTVDPPLTGDATNLALRIVDYGYPNQKLVGWGFEDFSVEFDSAAHPMQAFNLAATQYCWFYNVKFPNFSRPEAGQNGSCIKISDSYRCEIRKCVFIGETGSGGDGLIETGGNSSVLITDNIFLGPVQYQTYDSGNSNNTVISYNYAEGNVAGRHDAHPTLNLVEGNYSYWAQSDAYHGSSSDNTYYSNVFYGGGTGSTGWFSLWIGAFKRRYVVARNMLGEDGVSSARIGWGMKNYNTNGIGFAGPTGLSNQVGQAVWNQPGYGAFEYIIQSADVFSGDFWADWKITGTLTTKISSTEGVFAVSGGRWVVGADIYPKVWWNSKANSAGGVGKSAVTNVSGSNITMTFSEGDALPDAGTSVLIFTGPLGYQEIDLDAQASATVIHNRFGSGSGTGSIQNSSGDTFPSSLAWSAKPSWVGTLPWPPFNPDNVATQDPERLPAGYRYLNGNEDYLGGVSTPQFLPVPGIYGSGQTVTISSATAPTVTFYYTIDGSTPTTSSTLYSDPFTLPNTTTTLKAIGVKTGLANSSVQIGTYTIGAVPTAASGLNATAVSSSQINLTWNDNSGTETGFRLERMVNDGPWITVTTLAQNTTSYSNTGLAASTTYNYRVVAFNAVGDGADSNTVSATTQSEGGGGGGSGSNTTIQTLNVTTLNIL